MQSLSKVNIMTSKDVLVNNIHHLHSLQRWMTASRSMININICSIFFHPIFKRILVINYGGKVNKIINLYGSVAFSYINITDAKRGLIFVVNNKYIEKLSTFSIFYPFVLLSFLCCKFLNPSNDCRNWYKIVLDFLDIFLNSEMKQDYLWLLENI